METIKQFLGNSVFWFFMGILLALFLVTKCGSPNVMPVRVVERTIDYKYDTIIKVIYDTVRIDNSITKVDTTKVYDTIYKNKYFEQLFSYKQGTINITTYGGFTDSLDLDIAIPEKTITVTKTITNTKLTQYNNSVELEYLFNGSNMFLIGYGKNFGRISVTGKVGLDIDNITPMAGLSGRINF